MKSLFQQEMLSCGSAFFRPQFSSALSTRTRTSNGRSTRTKPPSPSSVTALPTAVSINCSRARRSKRSSEKSDGTDWPRKRNVTTCRGALWNLSTMTSSRLAIRVDADSSIGAGHLMRCLALAQEWKRTLGDVTFLAASDTPELHSRLRLEGMSVQVLSCDRGGADDASQTVSRGRELGVDWMVVDGYHFDANYQRPSSEPP